MALTRRYALSGTSGRYAAARLAADPDVPDGFHLRASRATIPPGGTVLGVLTLFDASSYQR